MLFSDTLFADKDLSNGDCKFFTGCAGVSKLTLDFEISADFVP